MLAERIVGLCPEKLKPVFIELLQGTPLNDYSKAVASLVEGSPDAGRDDEVDAVGEDTVSKTQFTKRIQILINIYLEILLIVGWLCFLPQSTYTCVSVYWCSMSKSALQFSS
jgi:hypothetical protein